MRRASKVDANQGLVVQALRAIGCRVEHLHAVGKGCPDLLVGAPNRRLILLEVKDGTRPPSDRRLTEDQVLWHAEWQGWPVYVVTSVEDALRVCTDARPL